MISREDRFWQKVMPEPNSGCWLWIGGRTERQYGLFWNGDRTIRAHRFSFEMGNGLIDDELVIDHLCKNPACVNPQHLEAVTQAENVRRGNAGKKEREKTHCKRGHPLYGANIRLTTRGARQCITCYNDLRRKRRAAKRMISTRADDK